MQAIDSRLDATYNAFTGHDSWDNWGRFAVTGFGGEGAPVTPYVYLVRLDPVRLKGALGLLPGVPVVELGRDRRRRELVRRGDTTSALQVIVEASGLLRGDAATHHTVAIPSGATRVSLPAELSRWAQLRVIADGDTYAVPEPTAFER
jgi:hypothetical protein